MKLNWTDTRLPNGKIKCSAAKVAGGWLGVVINVIYELDDSVCVGNILGVFKNEVIIASSDSDDAKIIFEDKVREIIKYIDEPIEVD